jgi:hypothetical protein
LRSTSRAHLAPMFPALSFFVRRSVRCHFIWVIVMAFRVLNLPLRFGLVSMFNSSIIACLILLIVQFYNGYQGNAVPL